MSIVTHRLQNRKSITVTRACGLPTPISDIVINGRMYVMSRLLAVASLADAGLCNPSGGSCVRDCMQFLIAQLHANTVPELEQHGGICHLMLAEK